MSCCKSFCPCIVIREVHAVRQKPHHGVNVTKVRNKKFLIKQCQAVFAWSSRRQGSRAGLVPGPWPFKYLSSSPSKAPVVLVKRSDPIPKKRWKAYPFKNHSTFQRFRWSSSELSPELPSDLLGGDSPSEAPFVLRRFRKTPKQAANFQQNLESNQCPTPWLQKSNWNMWKTSRNKSKLASTHEV